MEDALRDQIQEILIKADGGKDVYDNMVNAVNSLKSKANTEKSAGIKFKTSHDELKTELDTVVDVLATYGYDSETDLEDFIKGLKTKTKVKPKEKDDDSDDDDDDDDGKNVFDINKSPEFKKQQKLLEKMSTELEGEKTKNLKAQKEKENNLITRTLQGAFKNDKGEYSHYGAESRVENLVLTNKLIVDPEISNPTADNVLWNNPADKDLPIDFKEGFAKFIEAPEVKRDLKNNQEGGGGSGGSGKTGDGKETDAERIKHINANAKFNFRK